jgi:YebC/PmpR family DNA-binding regulatory protein
MSGHSKWSTIKRKKASTDAARAKVWTKLLRAVEVAAREGGGNLDANPTLASTVQKAKQSSVPNDNIDRAIKRGTGELQGESLDEITYEGYAPGGIAVIVQCLTNNRNRTSQDVRAAFNGSGGKMAEPGAVAWMFEPKGIVLVPKSAAGGDPALRSLGSVLQEQTLVALVQKTGKDATVVAKPAVEHLRGSARTIDELRRLDLDFLIDASVEPLPDATVRLHTKVVRLSDLRILSAQDYALPHDSLLARRHEVATELADRLMTAVARSRMSESAANLDARDRALTGESALDRGDLAMALGRLEEAVTADPANPWSRALLARALVGAALAGIAPFQETLERARLEARRVLDVDRGNPDARAVLGAVQLWDEADVDEATRSLQVAVRGPGASTDAKLWLAATLYLNANTAAADELIRGLGQERPMTFGVTDLQQRVLALAASVERNPQRAANAGAGR